MPKSLVIPLDDELHKRFSKLCKDHGECLKNYAYDIIKEHCGSYEAFLEEEEEERRKQEQSKEKPLKIKWGE
ncbi:MAG: hypothetical protein ABIH76_04680 [Candidatus Bathyarchaeota archaeon]